MSFNSFAGNNKNMDRKVKKRKSSLKSIGFTVFGSILVVSVFIGVFIYTNNISISVDDMFSNDKYKAEAFVQKRSTKPKPSFMASKFSGSSRTSVDIATNDGASANVEYDRADKQVKLMVLDRNDKPFPRLHVVAHISKAGRGQSPRSVRMIEHKVGQFKSDALNLADGGWILMVSAYNYFNREYGKLMFYSEQSIYLGTKKKKQG